jgi:hypothetical protein
MHHGLGLQTSIFSFKGIFRFDCLRSLLGCTIERDALFIPGTTPVREGNFFYGALAGRPQPVSNFYIFHAHYFHFRIPIKGAQRTVP